MKSKEEPAPETHPDNVSRGGVGGSASGFQSLGRYRPAASAITPWASSSGSEGGIVGTGLVPCSRKGHLFAEPTGLESEESGVCSPRGEPGSPGSSGKVPRSRDRYPWERGNFGEAIMEGTTSLRSVGREPGARGTADRAAG